MGNGSTVRDSGGSDPPSEGIGNGRETDDDGGASAGNDGSGLFSRLRLARYRIAVSAFDVFGHIWFEHRWLAAAVFVAFYAPTGWYLWWLHNENVWLAAVLGAVVFCVTIKVSISLAVTQTILFYQKQQQQFFAQMQNQALAHMEVDGEKPN